MPKVRTKSGKVKHYKYDKRGVAAAAEAVEEGGTIMNRKKKVNTYGIKYLKG